MLELNQIICGDCITTMDAMPAESIDLVVTSPPYNLHKDKAGWGVGFHKNRKFTNYDIHDDAMPWPEYVEWQRHTLTAMMRVLKPTGAIFYNQKWRITNQLRSTIVDQITNGFPIRQIIIWSKNGGINHDDRWFLPTYEVIYMICKSNFKLLKKANVLGTVWKFNTERSNRGHPAPFPLDLPLNCIKSTNAEIVLDPFCGSGTTLLASKLLNRNYIGIDISEKYCNLSHKRVQQQRLEELT